MNSHFILKIIKYLFSPKKLERSNKPKYWWRDWDWL